MFGKARIKIAGVPAADLPAVTLIIAAYNEEDFIREKIANTLALEYPEDKLQIIFITDGSSDATPTLARGYDRITVLHRPERKGKVAAMHRAMQQVTTPIAIFSDANTLLNKESIYNIARHYLDPKTGGVAGEKRSWKPATARVAGIGEGLYWKYESFLKKQDAELYTVVGAAGELFSIRTQLYEPVGDNVLLDDFVISLRVCQKGYRVHYEPDAYAMETPSASLKDERKRKIRISAGAFQSMGMLAGLLNFFKYPVLSFQYISHRVLRWTLCPLLLPVIFIFNLVLVLDGAGRLYELVLAGQILFYLAAIAGWMLANRNVKSKLLYVPYYFFFLNFSLYQGFFRHLRGRQSVLWDKARRETPTPAQ
ncbi:glycosyltransferase family 2 protein [Puia sp. P3]|uniref:glycosyltransferase family 2 protein n=1 Tax=Puia sp. P3 TaxID=3423952 RepID=UPI003D67E584